jgi:transcription initiation factor TFIIE subunit alpha
MKSINREYYYIDYRHAIDAAKYKIHKIDERIKKDARPDTQKAEFFCNRCKSQWVTLDVVEFADDLLRDSGFLCPACKFPLTAVDDEEGAAVDNDDTPAKFNRLFKPLLDLMQQIDDVTIPAIDGKQALESAVELPRDKEINPGAKHEVVQEATSRPTAVKGTNNVQEKINVNIKSEADYSEANRAAAKAQADKIAAQNQLPEWHARSTVKPQNTVSTAAAKAATNGADTPTIKTEDTEAKTVKPADLDDVFKAIQAEQKREDEEDEDEEEDDDDEFEDVPAVLPDPKRTKLDSSAAPTPTNAATPAVSTGDGGDESDEDEFEDV